MTHIHIPTHFTILILDATMRMAVHGPELSL
jgi:hypothetical protein